MKKLFFTNFSVFITDLKLTNSLFLFGTSIPIVPLPGIGAIILIPKADKLKAMSSSRFLIFETFKKYSLYSEGTFRVGFFIKLYF